MSNKRNRSNRSTKINGGKVLDGLAQGQNQREIAQTMQVHPSSIGRFLNKIKPYLKDLEDITLNRGNIFNLLHSKSLNIQHSILDEVDRIIEENEKKDFTKRMKLPSLLYCLRGIGMNQAVLYDKMRLEGGMSTNNIGIAGMIQHAHREGMFDENGEFKASLVGVVEKKTSTEADALPVISKHEENH